MATIAQLVFLFAVSTLLIQVQGECDQRTTCQNSRDVITHVSGMNNRTETTETQEMWWRIVPRNANGNILLAFKKFVSLETEVIYVHITKTNNEVETQTLSGQLGNFEVIASDVDNVLINFTKTPKSSVNFTLHYYGDCGFATVNPITHFGIEEGQKCTVIVPETNADFNRIYVTMRNIKLQANLHLKVQDVHTLSTLADVKNEEYYKVLALESEADASGTNSFYILIDLECSTATCNYEDNYYLISFYVLSRLDISCIEFQKFCLQNPYTFPFGWCQTTCPAMVKMMEQEYTFEVNSFLLEDNNATITYPGISPTLKKQHCPFNDMFCQCNYTGTQQLKRYCLKSIKCLKMRDTGCTWMCILTKMYVCPNVKRLEVTLI